MKTILLMVIAICSMITCHSTQASTTSTILKSEEGFRSTPYVGPQGYIHIGYGYKLHSSKGLDPKEFLVEISEEVGSLMLDAELIKIRGKLEGGSRSSTFNKLNAAKQDVLISMAYQMGYKGLLTFKKMWTALDNDNPIKAYHEALDSLWAVQTKSRAERHAFTLLTGIPYDYE